MSNKTITTLLLLIVQAGIVALVLVGFGQWYAVAIAAGMIVGEIVQTLHRLEW